MQHDEICSKLAQRVIELASGDYASLSQVTDISLLYANSPSTRMPVMYKPGIVILFQGKKPVIWATVFFITMRPNT